MSKYITLEQDIQRIENCLSAIRYLINEDKFKSYGKYAHYYGKNYNGGDKARHQVRRTMNSLSRLFKNVVKKGILDKDIDTLKYFLNLQFEYGHFQYLTILH